MDIIREGTIVVPIEEETSVVGKKISYYSAPVVLQWWTSGAPVMRQWCDSGATVVRQYLNEI
jgi:hypothetical protein